MATKYETPYDRMNRQNREEAKVREVKNLDRKAIGKVKPGAPYYQPIPNEASDRALTRAKAQGEYMKKHSGDDYQRDEGVLADTSRLIKNIRAGKSDEEAIEHGDRGLMSGAYKAGIDAVMSQAKSELQRESRGMAKGGKVSSASGRADGCATKGKTKGTMITMKNGGKC
jgi:hypothetical protein